MKKYLLFLAACLVIIKANTQSTQLWGLASSGGIYENGVIFSYDPNTLTYTDVFNFNDTSGANPEGGLMQATNGLLYGMTSNGGTSSYGVIFSYDLSTSTYTDLFNFDSSNGASPLGSLIQATNGLLYGMTETGGTSNDGVIFSYNITTSNYTILTNFNGANGAGPQGSLMQDTNGLLYGMTEDGGTNGYGVIFSYDLSTSTYTDKFNFDSSNGEYPFAGLIQTSNGMLYGITTYGGTNDGGFEDGVIFSYAPNTSTYTDAFNFYNLGSGIDPVGNLVQATDGLLYGMTKDDGTDAVGVIFSYDPNTSIYTDVFNFNDTSGAGPYGSMMQATGGLLYGMTSNGGTNNRGVIFSYNPSTSTYTDLFNFNDSTGDYPFSGSLIELVPGATAIPGGLSTSGCCGLDVKVYPNPFSDLFHLSIASSSAENLDVSIFNVMGQQIEERKAIPFGADITIGGNQASGLYVIKVKQGTEEKMLSIVKVE